jgi:lipid-A-disaccharide synthase
MRYYLIAGEASGDLHGSSLMKALKTKDKDADFRFFGGDLMQKAGGQLVKHYNKMAFMGYWDVLMNIKTIKGNIEFCKSDLLVYRPDVLILIDYPGFNLRIAEFAKKHNIKVFYYISPKFWAWKEYRVKKVRSFVDEMFTIFPFETAFYKKHRVNVHYVGNPLLDAIREYQESADHPDNFRKENNLDERPVIALLAGSRIKEVQRILPVMVNSLIEPEKYQYIVAGVGNLNDKLYTEIIGDKPVKIIHDQTYCLLDNAYAALVASGTATLETALFNVPQIAVYRMEGGRIIDFLFRNFVLKTTWVTLPNIILQKPAIIELIQKEMTVKKVKAGLKKLLNDDTYRKQIKDNYARLKDTMGESGCSERTAEKMYALLTETG